MSKNINDLQRALNQAAEEGVISQTALQVIDPNDTILAGMDGGMDIDAIAATEVTLLTFIIDNSGSIRFAKLADAIRQGQNQALEGIAKSKQKDNLLISQWKLGSDSDLIHSYVPVDQAVRLDKTNYDPNSGTALYDVWIEVAAANVAYAQQLKASGTPVKNILVVFTDGQDQGSRKYGIDDCKRLNADLLRSEQFILAFVGMGETPADEARFRVIAEEMGFPDGSILTAGATPSEIRKVFDMVSQKSVSASRKVISVTAQNAFFTP